MNLGDRVYIGGLPGRLTRNARARMEPLLYKKGVVVEIPPGSLVKVRIDDAAGVYWVDKVCLTTIDPAPAALAAAFRQIANLEMHIKALQEEMRAMKYGPP